MDGVGAGVGYGELRRGWRILPPCMFGIMLCSTHSYSLGVMIAPLEREFGWPRAEISGGLLIVALVALVGAPLIGMAADRLGPRRIALVGVPFFCGALALLSTATANIVSWWALWGLLAVANMFLLPTIWTKAINGAFDANRGIALALALCGTGIAAALAPSLANWLTASFGWRQAYVGLGLAGLLVVFPITWFMFRPEAGPAGTAPGEPALAIAGATGVSVAEGFRMPSFLKLAAAIWLFATALCAMTTNGVPVLLARGLSPAAAAGFAGLLGIGSILGRLVGGVLLDRFDAAKVAAASVAMPIIAVGLLLGFPHSEAVAGPAFLIIGLAAGTEIDCCAYLAGRHFGLRSFGALFGMLNGLMLFGNGVAPVVANHVYDVTKSYEIVLWAQIPAYLVAALLFLRLGPYPRYDAAGPAGAPA